VQFKSFAALVRSAGWRYFLALALLAAVVVVRLQLTPWIGGESPLLVLLVPVVIAALLLGYGTGVLIALLAPVLATVFLHQQLNSSDPWGWIAHVALYETLAVAAIVLIEQLRRSHERIQQDEERLRLAMDSAQLGVFEWWPARGQFLLGNPRMVAMLGSADRRTTHPQKCGTTLPGPR